MAATKAPVLPAFFVGLPLAQYERQSDMMIRHILVPIDFSEGSRAALRYAVELAERLDATIDALHVWEPAPYIAPTQLIWIGEDARSFWTHMDHSLREQLTALIAEEAAEAHIPISAQVQAGYVAQSLLERLKHGNYDLVVMGTHGRTGLSHLLLGSVAERVVRLAPCPVLTIRVPMHREKELSIARAERERHAHDTDTPTRN